MLEPGPYGSWDEYGVADPCVVRIEPYFYLFYLGQDRARRQRLGVARSTDGVRWEKLRANPVLELGDPGAFDENGLGEPAVWNSHGFYWMLYTGRDTTENRRLGLARSTDGVHWRKLRTVFSGNQPWDAKVVCDPRWRWRAASSASGSAAAMSPRPDENLHGQIGLRYLRPGECYRPPGERRHQLGPFANFHACSTMVRRSVYCGRQPSLVAQLA